MVKIAITIDVEGYQRAGKDKYKCVEKTIPKLISLFNQSNIKITWFIVHDRWDTITKKFPFFIDKMDKNGELGCHVHFMDKKNKYNIAYDFQKELIGDATKFLRNKGFDIASFRGGAYFFNQDTLKVLEELNYLVDSSVIPGYYALHASNGIIKRKFVNFFPNKNINGIEINHKNNSNLSPYYLSKQNYNKKGNSKILEIPLVVNPILNIDIGCFSRFLSLPISLISAINDFSIIDRLIKRKYSDSYIVLNSHPINFYNNLDIKLKKLNNFIKEYKKRKVEFSTLREIYDDYQKRKI